MIAIINLISIITRNVTKTFKLSFTKNVDTFQIKIKKIEKRIFEKNKKDLIDNVII